MEYECRYFFDEKPTETKAVDVELMTYKEFSEFINS